MIVVYQAWHTSNFRQELEDGGVTDSGTFRGKTECYVMCFKVGKHQMKEN